MRIILSSIVVLWVYIFPEKVWSWSTTKPTIHPLSKNQNNSFHSLSTTTTTTRNNASQQQYPLFFLFPATNCPTTTTRRRSRRLYSAIQEDVTTTTTTTTGGKSYTSSQRVTLTRYLSGIVQDQPELRDMESLLLSVQMACKTISNLVNRAGINHQLSLNRGGFDDDDDDYDDDGNNPMMSRSEDDLRRISMKKLDQLSTAVLRNSLRFTGKLSLIKAAKDDCPYGEEDDGGDSGPASHQPGVLIASGLDNKYVACFDPLDGSGNADATICTGTVFGVFETNEENNNNNKQLQEEEQEAEEEGIDNVVVGGGDGGDGTVMKPTKPSDNLVKAVLQPGKNLRAAGYCLYSSATILVFTLGNGTHGFTLDPQINEFVLTHPNIRIPQKGNVYSCNEANSEAWDTDLKNYVRALKTGNNPTQQRYALRYVGSMAGDIHRTLMYGGIFFYPSDNDLHPQGNLQLLYKIAPMSYIVDQAGGKCTNGKTNLLNIAPRRVHERSPCFIGSPQNIDEMKQYIPHID